MKLLLLVIFLFSAYWLWRLVLHPKMMPVQTLGLVPHKHFFTPSKFHRISTSSDQDQDDKIEIRMFDEVAKLLFEKKIRKRDLQSAKQIQYDFLNKMPMRTRSQLQQFEGNEWSILWEFHNQSLEYYASRYGVFYTHIDAKGREHKSELKLLS